MVCVSPVKIDFSKELITLARLQKRIRKIYAATLNNKMIQKKANTFLQPLLEIRYAWEHFSDALLGADGEWNHDTALGEAEIAEARGHLLRCYTDLTEIRFLLIKMYAKKVTGWLRREEIESAMPGYYAAVFPLYGKVEKTINELKGAPEQGYDKRIELLDQANEHCEAILDKLNENALKELRRKGAVSLLFSVLKFAGAAVGGGLITLLLQYIFQ